jgi:hypothetical protein
LRSLSDQFTRWPDAEKRQSISQQIRYAPTYFTIEPQHPSLIEAWRRPATSNSFILCLAVWRSTVCYWMVRSQHYGTIFRCLISRSIWWPRTMCLNWNVTSALSQYGLDASGKLYRPQDNCRQHGSSHFVLVKRGAIREGCLTPSAHANFLHVNPLTNSNTANCPLAHTSKSPKNMTVGSRFHAQVAPLQWAPGTFTL